MRCLLTKRGHANLYDAIFCRAMTYTITVVPSNHTFTVKEGQDLISAALENDIVLPYSCRNGSCTSCKGRVVSGEYETGNGTQQLLQVQERDQGYTLFCETKPKSDLVVEAREVRLASDIVIRKMPVRVVGMEQAAPDVMILKLQMPATEPFRFMPGQYLEFILKDGRRRAYSMASRPNGTEPVELHIRHTPGGVFTDHVFGAGATQMKEREILRVEAPMGSFFLRDDSEKPMIFLASGTGFAPIKAIMEQVVEQGISRPITLYWGGRRPRDLYMSELANKWQGMLPNFTFVPVISDALPEDNWTGRTGFVHAAVLEDFEDLSGYQVYACGAPVVVDSARQAYTAKAGLPENEFYADSFTTEADVARLNK